MNKVEALLQNAVEVFINQTACSRTANDIKEYVTRGLVDIMRGEIRHSDILISVTFTEGGVNIDTRNLLTAVIGEYGDYHWLMMQIENTEYFNHDDVKMWLDRIQVN